MTSTPIPETWTKVIFSLSRDEGGYPPADTEGLWARPADGGYVLENIPFFVVGVSYGDTVEAERVDSVLEFRDVLNRAGHGTVRVVVANALDIENVRADLAAFGCATEKSHLPRLIAVDIPPDIDFEPIVSYLLAGHKHGRFDYEEACVYW